MSSANSDLFQNLSQSSDLNKRLSALNSISSMSADVEARTELYKMGCIPPVVNCLDTFDEQEKSNLSSQMRQLLEEIVKTAAGGLLNMAIEPEGRDQIVQSGAVPKLLRHLDILLNQLGIGGASEEEENKVVVQLTPARKENIERTIENLVGAVMNLSDSDEARDQISDKRFDGVRIMYDCFHVQNIEVQKNTMGAFAALVLSAGIVDQLMQIDQFYRIIECLESGDEDVIVRTAGAVWNMSSCGDPVREALSMAGAVDQIVNLLKQEDDHQPETLSNLLMALSVMSASRKVGELVKDVDGLNLVADLVDYFNEDEDPDNGVATAAIAAVWNLSHTPQNKDEFQKMGIVEKILNFLDANQGNTEVMEKVCGALLTLGSNPAVSEDFRSMNGFDSLKPCLKHPKKAKLSLFAVISVAVLGYDKDTADDTVESGVVELLIKNFLGHNSENILEKTTACFLNISASKKVCTEIREKDGIRGLVACLSHPNQAIQSNAAGALWNMSSVDPKNKAILKNLGALKPLLNAMSGGKNPPKSEAERTISDEEYQDALEKAEAEVPPTKQIRGEYEPNVQVNDKPRDHRFGLGEHGEEDDLPKGKVLIAAGPLNIARRLARLQAEDPAAVNHIRAINAQRQKEEDEAREEADRKEREARAKRLEEERKQREEERRREEEEQRRIEEEKKKAEEEAKRKEEEERQLREQERLRQEAEEEMQREAERIKREQEEKKKLLAEQEAMKQKMEEAYKHKTRRGVDDEDFIWEDDVVSKPSSDAAEALQRFNNRDQMLRDFVNDDDKLLRQLTDDERNTILFGCDQNVDWLNKNPNASAAEIDQKRRELEDAVAPILGRLAKKKELTDLISGMRKRLQEDPALLSMSDADRKLIQKALDDSADWLAKNPNASLDELKEQLNKVHNIIDPIVHRAETRKTLEDTASALKRALKNDDRFANLSDKERKLIEDTCDEILDFLRNNPNATLDDLAKLQMKYDENVKPIVDRLNALDDLEELSRDFKRHMLQDPLLANSIKNREKQNVVDKANETIDWSVKNPTSWLDEIKGKRDQLKAVGDPALRKVERRNELRDAINSIRDRMRGGAYLAALLESDRQKLERVHKRVQDSLADPDADVDQIEKDMKKDIDDIVKRADKIVELEEYCRSMKRRVEDDPRLASLSKEEQKQIRDACQDALDFLKRNPNANFAEISEQKRRAERVVDPLVNKAEYASNLRDEVMNLRRRLNEDARLANNLSQDEKRKIEIACDNALSFLEKNPNASAAEILAEKEKMNHVIDPIITRAEKKTELEDLVSNMRNRVYNDRRLADLSDADKTHILQQCDDVINWMNKNPDAKISEMAKKQNELIANTSDILSRVDLRGDLEDHVRDLKKRLNNGEFAHSLSEKDKRNIIDACDDLVKKLQNKDMTEKELLRAKDVFESAVVPIVNKGDAINNLIEYIDDVTNRFNNDPTMVHLSESERKQLEKEIAEKRAIAEKLAAKSRDGLADELVDTAKAIAVLREAQDVIEPLFNKVGKADELLTKANEYLHRVNNDHKLFNNLSHDEKNKIRDAAENAIEFLKQNPDATTEEIQQALRKLEEVKPIINRVDAKNALVDHANDIKKRVLNDPKYASLSDQERNQIISQCDDTLKWIEQNPKSSLSDILKKHQDLDNIVDPLMTRAESKYDFDESISALKRRVDEDKRLVSLSDQERNLIKKQCDDLLNWSKLNPAASKGDMDKQRKQMAKIVNPLVERAEKRSDVAAYAENAQDDVRFDERLSSLSKQERDAIHKKADDALGFLAKNPNATIGQMTQEQHKAEDNIDPLVTKAENHHALAQSVADLQSRLSDDYRLKSGMSAAERSQLAKACDDCLDWLNKNPNASIDEIEKKKKHFESLTTPIIKRVEEKNSLEDYCDEMNRRLNEDEKLTNLSDAEKQKIVNKLAAVNKWLRENPNATSGEILAKRKDAENVIEPLVKKAENRHNLTTEAQNLLNRVNSDDMFNKHSSQKERDQVVASAENVLNYLKANPNLSSSEIDEKRAELQNIVEPTVKKTDHRISLEKHAKDIKNRVQNDPSLFALTEDEKKRLTAAADDMLNYLAKNPNASAKELNQKDASYKNVVEPLLNKAESSQVLKQTAENALKRLEEDGRLTSRLGEAETKKIRDAAKESLAWLDKNKHSANKAQIDHNKAQLDRVLKPMMDRIDELNALEDDAANLKRRVDQDSKLSALSDKEQSDVTKHCADTENWVANNPNSSVSDIKKQRATHDRAVNPAVSRAEAANDLKDYSTKCIDDATRLKNELSQEEARKVVDTAKQVMDWLKANEKTASKSEILQKKRELERELKPILDRAEKKKQMEDYMNDVKNKLDNEPRFNSKLKREEADRIRTVLEEAAKWKKNNPDATLAELHNKEAEIRKALDPIINRVDELNKLEDYAKEALQDIDTLGNHLSEAEKREVRDAANKTLDWVSKNKHAPLLETVGKRKELEEKINPTITRGYQKKELIDYAQETKNKLLKDDRMSILDNEEKRIINNKCTELENWVKANPNASVAEIKRVKQEGEAVIQPLVERAESHGDLKSLANSLSQETEEMGDNLSKQDKEKIINACKDTVDWLEKNKKASKAQIEAKKKELEKVALPILSGGRLMKELEKELTDYRQMLKNDDRFASLSDAQKSLVNKKLDEIAQWLKDNPNATKEAVARKRDELKRFIDEMLDNQEAHKDLKDYAEKVLKVLEHNKDVRRAMSEKDRQTAKDYAEDLLDWLRRNPNASASEVREKKREAVIAINNLRGWKFEVPYAQFVGHRFTEQTRWGLAHNRVNPWELNFGSYLKAAERRGDQPKPSYTTQGPKFDSMYIPTWQKSSEGDKKWGKKPSQADEDDKKFEAMKSKMVSPVLRAKLDSLTDTAGKSKTASGPQIEQQNLKTYTYAELKDKKSSELPSDVKGDKREQYLSDAEFEKVFGMNKSAFLMQPEFIQMKQKKDKGLFSYAYEN